MGGVDGGENGDQLGTDGSFQGQRRHFYGTHMVGDHLPHEVTGDTAGGAGVFHTGEHGLHDRVHLGLVEAKLPLSIGMAAAARKDLLHVFDAFCLLDDDSGGDSAEFRIGGVVENIAGHFYGCAVVGNHLDNEVVGNTVSERSFCHFADHGIENFLVTG